MTVEPTDYNPGSREPNKGENNVSGKEEEKDGDDSMMIAIIAGVAAVICVAIVLLCVWLILSQRKKNRYSVISRKPRDVESGCFPRPC